MASSAFSPPARAPVRAADTPPVSAAQAAAAVGLERPGRLRARTLVALRWLAIGGQAVALLITAFVLRFPAPYAACFIVIGLSAWLNLLITSRR